MEITCFPSRLIRCIFSLSREKIKRMCVPHGIRHKQTVPMLACFVALTMSGIGSWHCSYFQGATISFTGNTYGLWTLEDVSGKCQLWDVLFFAYDLGAPLTAARCFSIATLLIGLALLTTMAQALEFHAFSWGIGMMFFVLFIVSVSTTSIYNVWVVFWLFTYISFILIVRSFFIFPVHRRISGRGTKIVAFCLALCGICSLLTLVVLKSDFCTCSGLSAERLAGRVPGDPCEGTCHLRAAGYLQVFSSAFWFLAAGTTLKYGVQPKEICGYRCSMYATYLRTSIFSRLRRFQKEVAREIQHVGISGVCSQSWRSKSHGSRTMRNVREKSETNESDQNEMSDLRQVASATTVATSPSVAGCLSDSFASSIMHPGSDTQFESELAVEDEECQSESLKADKEEEGQQDTRPCCSKICCDYRITPRDRKEKWMFWLFRVALGLLVAAYIFLVVVIIGERIENTNAAKAPDTSYNFITEVVCAFNPLDPSQPFETFATRNDAENAGYVVAHCGECGFCSNPSDIEVYVETRKVIAKRVSKECGLISVFGKYDALVDCLERNIGFTRPCTECWADNLKSTVEHCRLTCMVTLWTGFMSDNNVPGSGDQGWLNQCVYCDEKMSGPAFVKCSGASRRRLGIVSEVERNPAELCKNVEVDYVNVDFDQLFVKD